MPQITSAKKRVRVQARQTAENRLHRARSRTTLKKIRELTAAGNTKQAIAEFATLQTYLDKAAKTGAWHTNTSARYKSRVAQALKKAGNQDMIPGRSSEAAAKQKPKRKPAKTSRAKSTQTGRSSTAKKTAAKSTTKTG